MVNSITNTFIFVIIFMSFLYGRSEEAKAYLSEGPEVWGEQAQDQKKIKKIAQSQKTRLKTEGVMTFGAGIWGERILLETADGRSEDIQVDYTGVNLGLDYIWKWEKVGLDLGLQAFLFQGQAQSTGPTITYKNKIDQITPVILWTGVQFYPHDKVHLGFKVGAAYYSVKLEPPTSVVTNYDFKYSSKLQAVGQLQLGWQLSNNLVFQNEMFASQNGKASAGWNVSLGHIF